MSPNKKRKAKIALPQQKKTKGRRGSRASANRRIESWRIMFLLASLIDSMDITSELMQKSEDHLERAAEYETPSKAPGGFNYNEQEILPALEEFAYS
jgi:hypothetical protein